MSDTHRDSPGTSPDPFELTASLAKLVDPQQAYHEVLRLLTHWFNADSGQIIVVDVTTGQPVVRAVSSSLTDADLNFSRTILEDALRRDRPVCIADAKQHAAYRTAESVVTSKGAFLSVLVMPLHDREGLPRGALYLQRRSGKSGFYDDSRDLDRLARFMDTLAPLLLNHEQRVLLQSERVERVKARISEMGYFVGPSGRMADQVYDRIERYAQSELTVCVQGETGSGKEWVAEAIHRLSRRAEGPYVRVPCNAISEGLAESEFFGHVKGAFAQAYNDKPGQFEMADGGTLFLDEISQLSPEVQSKLLHVLERGRSRESSFFRVGGVKEIKVNVRVIASSNRDLRAMVSEGRFREDLFHRLNQLPLHVPPLRERPEDILPLAEGFLGEANCEHSRRIHLSAEARRALGDYSWPGNVRELKNCIHRAVLLRDASGALLPEEIFRDRDVEDRQVCGEDEDLLQGIPFRQLSREQKRDVVRAAFRKYGNARKAARALGISHQTVYNYLGDE
jgi:transcriptional regulator with GAF, ATPase, and Fis domain